MQRTFLVLLAACGLAAKARATDPGFSAGWAAGALAGQFEVEAASVSVEGGTATVTAPQLRRWERRSAARLLLGAPGVRAVRFSDEPRLYTRQTDDGAPSPFHAFPRRLLFDPLLADPRWPQFSGTVVRHFRSNEHLVFDGNVGETFTFFGTDRWQFGLQAGIFTQFDMLARHDDQMTDDFLAGFPFSWRTGRVTSMARIYHISAHTGDEYLLHHPGFERIKQSFEAVDYRASYELPRGWRVYGGPGYIYRRFPLEMKPLYAQAGAEWTSSWAWRGLIRPVAAVDLQKHQNYGWGATDVSVRAGFQIEHKSQASRRALVLLDYYRGRDYNGQFYGNPDEYLGLGLHVFF